MKYNGCENTHIHILWNNLLFLEVQNEYFSLGKGSFEIKKRTVNFHIGVPKPNQLHQLGHVKKKKNICENKKNWMTPPSPHVKIHIFISNDPFP